MALVRSPPHPASDLDLQALIRFLTYKNYGI